MVVHSTDHDSTGGGGCQTCRAALGVALLGGGCDWAGREILAEPVRNGRAELAAKRFEGDVDRFGVAERRVRAPGGEAKAITPAADRKKPLLA